MRCDHCGADPVMTENLVPLCRWHEVSPEASAAGFDPPCVIDEFLEDMKRRERRSNWITLGVMVSLVSLIVLWWMS
jgi:hypothetical protein